MLREALYRPGSFEEKYQAALDELKLTSVAVRTDVAASAILAVAGGGGVLERVVR
jgi:hypothetical protein